MRSTYYVFPDDMPIRDCYDAWAKGTEGYEPPPSDMTDEEVERDFPRRQFCTVTKCKKMMKKYGGYGYTEHVDRDGSMFEVTYIKAKGNNAKTTYGAKYNRYL